MIYSGDKDLDCKISLWLGWDRNQKTRCEIQELVDKKDWTDLRGRLMERLTFGTAGLRGVMRAGFNSMNDLVIVQTAQGLCEYMVKQFPNCKDQAERGIVLGYDGRHNSRRFAEITANVFLHRNIKVLLYSRMVPTPFVPFAIMQLNCLAGVMVTASHNPKDDNGYKVYWENGAQIIPPHDKNIQRSIEENLEPKDSSWNSSDALCNNPLLVDPYENLNRTYYECLLANIPKTFLDINKSSKLCFVHTAMHGVGHPYVDQGFCAAKLGQRNVPVQEQMEADPEFSTVTFPNPEEGKSALELATKLADSEGISIILANDPDADRLACAEKDKKTGQWKVFNGNELGALLGWWALQNYKELNPDMVLSDSYMIASTVSSKILRTIASAEGFNFIETLTGFKWMGNKAKELIDQKKNVLFAFEEAIGFMFSTTVLDKDGVSAAIHLATMACYIKEKHNITLTEKLHEIYDCYGYHCTKVSYLFCYEPKVIERIFERLRNFQDGKPKTYPTSILNGKFPIKSVRDLTIGVDTTQPDGNAILPVSKSTQMITFTFENGLVITLRTSGTEPKIKYYAELVCKPDQKDWEERQRTLDIMAAAIVEEFYQPKLNNLTAKAE